jgi:acyl-CoA synthetase (AMP-forming)/AMP-acid ligase II
VQKHKVNILGRSSQFRMLWVSDYGRYDLSSLRFVAYAGSAVDLGFLNKLSAMAPAFGTGIGMTENAGFATFTPEGISIEEMAGQVGRSFPDLAQVTIRKPMEKDGRAGEELPDKEVGEICYHPPIVFLGYYNMPEETAKTISTEGILYTGDLGYFKDMGTYRALYLAGRRKFMIKQKGYNVFPDEVESHIAGLEGVDLAEVVGMPHRTFDEVFLPLFDRKGAEITADMVAWSMTRRLASYKRPACRDLAGWKGFSITRSTKVDKLALRRLRSPSLKTFVAREMGCELDADLLDKFPSGLFSPG